MKLETCKLVSIIIPCYNQGQYLEEAVTSTINQTYPNIEIIIINDGSTDNTAEIALNLQTKYPEKIRVITQKNSGVSEARNSGIREALGTYILPLDADDLIDKYMIDACLKCMMENNADILYVGIKYFGAKNFTDNKKPFSETHILYQNPCSVTSLYKKEIWNRLGGYSKNMKEGYEDWDFWINAFKHGFKFQLLSEPFLLYRTQKVSRNTNAILKDNYLKAKITLNHPELYTIDQVLKAINLLKKTDKLPDLYFYTPKNLLLDEKYLTKTISQYLTSYELQEKQIIDISFSNKKIALFALDILEDSKQLKRINKETEADFVLFYSTLRYEVPSLQNLDFAWDKDKGIKDVYGTIFPFVFKSERENPNSQLTAYKRLVRYQNEKIDIQQAEIVRQQLHYQNKDIRIQQKNKIIEDKNRDLLEKINLLKEMDEELKKNKINYRTMMSAIHKVISLPLKKKPIGKYRAYKSMIQIYYKLKSSK